MNRYIKRQGQLFLYFCRSVIGKTSAIWTLLVLKYLFSTFFRVYEQLSTQFQDKVVNRGLQSQPDISQGVSLPNKRTEKGRKHSRQISKKVAALFDSFYRLRGTSFIWSKHFQLTESKIFHRKLGFRHLILFNQIDVMAVTSRIRKNVIIQSLNHFKDSKLKDSKCKNRMAE